MSTPLHFTWRRTLPRSVLARAGVYAVFVDNAIAYIGSAVDLRKRLSTHGFTTRRPLRTTRFGSLERCEIRIAYNRRRFDHATRELRLIFRIAPPLNEQIGERRGRQRVVLANATPERFRRSHA